MNNFDYEKYCEGLSKSKDIIDCERVPVPECSEDQNYVFISYSHKDYKKVYQDLALMYEAGVRFWYDEELTAGYDWDDEVFKKIANPHCSGVIFFLSENFFSSPSILKEIFTTLGKNKEIDNSELPKNYFCVNLTNKMPSKLIDKALSALSQEIVDDYSYDGDIKDVLCSAFSDKSTYIPFALKAHKEKIIAQIRRKFNVIDLFSNDESLKGDYKGEMLDGKRSGQGTCRYSDGSVYVGQWKDNKHHGKGKITYGPHDQKDYLEGVFAEGLANGYCVFEFKNGDRYEGEMQDGKITGKFIYTQKDGTRYTGDFVDGEKSGYGEMEYNATSSRVSYKGEWHHNNFNGKGELIYRDGSKYEGHWKSGYYDGNGRFTYAESDPRDYVEGEWKKGKANGYALLKYRDGRIYEGTYENNDFCGEGKLTYSEIDNRAYHKGEWKGNKLNGKGALVYKSGAVFEGEWKDDKILNGTGTWEYSDGEVYIGEIKGGKKNGYGEYRWKNGSIYVGNFSDDKINGQGEYKAKNGDIYNGEWEDEKKNGHGEFRFKNGNIYIGEFKDGNYHGKGKYIYNESDNRAYHEGMWKDSKSNGAGELVYKSGAVFKGEWKDDKILNGTGTWEYDDGEVYIGEIKDGKRNGHGECTYPAGSGAHKRYEGEWKDDAWHGKGILEFFVNGMRYEGYFDSGVYHGKGVLTAEKGFYKVHPLKGTWERGSYQNKAKRIVDSLLSGYEIEYIGEKDEKGKPHGKGIRKFYDGTVMEGEFRHGVLHGYAVCSKNGKVTSEGNYVKGLINGYGKKYDGFGNWCEGEWKNENLIYGKYFSEGVLYEGGFKKGKFIGEGLFTFPDGTTCKCIDGKPVDPEFIKKLPEGFKGD